MSVPVVKTLEYQNDKGKWVIHYIRPEDHPDIAEWEILIKKNPRYRIVTAVEDRRVARIMGQSLQILFGKGSERR